MAITEYGFQWGSLEVIRAASDPKYGYWLEIVTPYRRMQVHASPTGLSLKASKAIKRRDRK